MEQKSRYGATESALTILEKIEENLRATSSWKELSEKLIQLSTDSLEKRPTSALLVNTLRNLLVFTKEKHEEKTPFEDFKNEFFSRIAEVRRKTLESVEKLSDIGARWLPENSVVLTHSYSNSVIKTLEKANRLGKIKEVYITESRPGGEGIYTAKLISSLGIKTNLIVDSAVNYFMSNIDFVLLGAEAITAHGALVNKVGSSQISLSAYKKRTRVIVMAGTYKFSFETMLGDRIRVPYLDASVLGVPDEMLALGNIRVSVPQMDVTPPEYIDAIVTELGITSPQGVPILLWEVYGEWLGKQPEITELLNDLKNIK